MNITSMPTADSTPLFFPAVTIITLLVFAPHGNRTVPTNLEIPPTHIPTSKDLDQIDHGEVFDSNQIQRHHPGKEEEEEETEADQDCTQTAHSIESNNEQSS